MDHVRRPVVGRLLTVAHCEQGGAIRIISAKPAGMVSAPADYPWSSYRANALGQTNPLLTPHEEYLALGADDQSRCAAYRDLFSSESEAVPIADLRMALQQNQPIGDRRFYAEVEAMTGQRRELKRRGRPSKQAETEVEVAEEGTQQALRSRIAHQQCTN